MHPHSYWNIVWNQFKKRKTATFALGIVILFFLSGLYAPIFASSKPLLVLWNGKLFSPLLRYLFYPGFYTKSIDIFYNVVMFTFPLTLIGCWVIKKRWRSIFLCIMALIQCVVFGILTSGLIKNPASDPKLKKARQETLLTKKSYREDPLLTFPSSTPTWNFELKHMNEYGKLNLLLRYRQQLRQHKRLEHYARAFTEATGHEPPTLYATQTRHEEETKQQLKKTIEGKNQEYGKALDELPILMKEYQPYSHAYIMAKYELEHAPEGLQEEATAHYQAVLKQSAHVRNPLMQAHNLIEAYRSAEARLMLLEEKQKWLKQNNAKLYVLIPAIFREFHWEEDAGGSQAFNTYLPWWELTRINRKDLVASLLFGIRVSYVVGFTAVGLSLLIGIPLGMLAGYFTGKPDLLICRFIEIWEAMPTFFMLMLVVAITQSKSIFLVVLVLGIFGWTTFGRFIRAEVLKQRTLPYVMACKSIGYGHIRIMFSHILPNAIFPVLTLLPFSMMAAITSEAGISFLGLGEEGSTSWGVLMDEGRSVFPAESYLLWPPAILLTVLLVCIALIGDALRDAIDPKLYQH